MPVSVTRSSPCLACRPSNTRFTSPSLPTSSPMMTIRGSRLRFSSKQRTSSCRPSTVSERSEYRAGTGLTRRGDSSERLVRYELKRSSFSRRYSATYAATSARAVPRLVALVAAARRVALRLRHLGDVEDRRDVARARPLRGDRVGLAAREVIPSLHDVQVVPGAVARALESPKDLADRAFRRLQLVRHRDPVAVVPDGNEERDAEHAGRVQRLPA